MKLRIRFVSVAKYVVLVAIFVYVIMLFVFISGTTRPFEEVTNGIRPAMGGTDLVEINGQGFRRIYGINPATLGGVMMFASEFRLSAEEVLVILVYDQDQIEPIRQTIEERLANQRQEFVDYNEDQVELIDNAQLVIRGNYIFFAVSERAKELRDIFLSSL